MLKYITIITMLLVFSCNQGSNNIKIDARSGKPMLIGKTEVKDFQLPEFSEWYNNEYDYYNPDEFILDELKPLIDGKNIDIFMGTWCSDSRREVPRFMKILDQLEFDNKNVFIVNIDRNKKSPKKFEKHKNIQRVPTFIIYNSDLELGRIIEYPIVTLESDLLEILLITQ